MEQPFYVSFIRQAYPPYFLLDDGEPYSSFSDIDCTARFLKSISTKNRYCRFFPHSKSAVPVLICLPMRACSIIWLMSGTFTVNNIYCLSSAPGSHLPHRKQGGSHSEKMHWYFRFLPPVLLHTQQNHRSNLHFEATSWFFLISVSSIRFLDASESIL